MKSLAEFEFLNHDFELIEEAKDEVYVKIERECRTSPMPGMKQPTPVGGMLGHEAVLTVKHRGERVKDYRWEIYHANSLVCSGATDAKGTAHDLQIPLPYGNPQSYSIKIFGPVTLTNIQEWVNGDTSGCNMPSEVSMRDVVIETIRKFLLEKLSENKYSPVDGSDHKDTSYIDFSKMIRLDVPVKHKSMQPSSTGPIHISVQYVENSEEPVVGIYLGNGNMSYKFWDLKVDIAAPEFGQLWATVEKYLQEAIAETRQPAPVIND